MSAALIPFPRTPLRAFVVIPGDEIGRDWCKVNAGGWPIDGAPRVSEGPLYLVLRRLQDDPRGLPVAVQLVGRPGAEAALLDLGARLDGALNAYAPPPAYA